MAPIMKIGPKSTGKSLSSYSFQEGSMLPRQLCMRQWNIKKPSSVALTFPLDDCTCSQYPRYTLRAAKCRVIRSKLCWLPARCIVAPGSTHEVSLVLKIIQFTGAKFSVRGGGHNPNRNWASVSSDGILVDLHCLKTLRLRQENNIISVGVGNRWSDVYRFLAPTGISPGGARVPDVGVSGQLLGGETN